MHSLTNFVVFETTLSVENGFLPFESEHELTSSDESSLHHDKDNSIPADIAKTDTAKFRNIQLCEHVLPSVLHVVVLISDTKEVLS